MFFGCLADVFGLVLWIQLSGSREGGPLVTSGHRAIRKRRHKVGCPSSQVEEVEEGAKGVVVIAVNIRPQVGDGCGQEALPIHLPPPQVVPQAVE